MNMLLEDLTVVVQAVYVSLGFKAFSREAVALVARLLLGIALNIAALGAVNAVHPLKRPQHIVCMARAEIMQVQSRIASILHNEHAS